MMKKETLSTIIQQSLKEPKTSHLYGGEFLHLSFFKNIFSPNKQQNWFKIKCLQMNEIESLDIDNEIDFNIAETIYLKSNE